MTHTESTFTGSGDVKLFYQSWQPESNKKVVLVIVHGFGEHSGRYMNIVNHLVPNQIIVYGFDHRGHGRSEGKRGHILSWQEFREDFKFFSNLIRENEKDLPVFILGHSMGGLITLNALLHHKENINGVIVSSPLLAQPGISPMLVMISRILSKIYPGFSIDTKLDVSSISRDPEVLRAYQDDPLVHSIASARFGTELTATIEWTQQNAAEFKLPLFVTHGSADILVPVQGSENFYNNAGSTDKKIQIYDGSFHEPHNDNDKEVVLKNIERWIFDHL